MIQTLAILVGAGRGERMAAGRPKVFLALAGQPLLLRSALAFEHASTVTDVVAVVPEALVDEARALLQPLRKLRAVVAGGTRRQDSVWSGLACRPPSFDGVVLVHDAARPLVTPALIDAVTAAALSAGAAIPVVPVADTIKRVHDGDVSGTVDRSELRAAQTPQGFRLDVLLAAYARAQADGVEVTDEAMAVERGGGRVATVEGDADNRKMTTPEDLRWAETVLGGGATDLRVGTGFDVHRLVAGRALRLGGITVPHDRGLEGHSDGDCVLHAVCDALLGAAGEGDMGTLFPSTDERWRGADSTVFLRHGAAHLRAAGVSIVNVDATVIAQAPKLAPHAAAMRAAVAEAAGLDARAVSIKVKSCDRLGAVGREEGIAAEAVALVRRPSGREPSR